MGRFLYPACEVELTVLHAYSSKNCCEQEINGFLMGILCVLSGRSHFIPLRPYHLTMGQKDILSIPAGPADFSFNPLKLRRSFSNCCLGL